MPLQALEASCEELGLVIQKETSNAIFVMYTGIVTGSADTNALMHVCLLVGAYMMLNLQLKEELELKNISAAFHSVEGDIIDPENRI